MHARADAAGISRPRSVSDVIAEAGRVSNGFGRAPVPTGFTPLDLHLSGGLRPGELAVVAGVQGLGKTTFTLQMARNIVAAGGAALYACFEHDEQSLLERLLALEAGLHAGFDAPPLTQLRRRLLRNAGHDLESALSDLPGGDEALRALASYGDRLQLMRARGDRTTVAALTAAVTDVPNRPVLFVDYLQKIADDDRFDEEARVARAACGLKDLALDLGVPVVAIASLERLGPDVRRARSRHLKGSVTLAYEADVILVLNAKHEIVARDHLVYGIGNLERYREQVVCSIEKNRAGHSDIDLEFTKRLDQSRLETDGALVSEHLVDDRIHME